MFGRALIGLIRVYQLVVSPWIPAACRFTPTCSTYAREAIERYGARRGGWFALRRLARCHPWGGHGYDPVPLPTHEELGHGPPMTTEMIPNEQTATSGHGRPTSSDI